MPRCSPWLLFGGMKCDQCDQLANIQITELRDGDLRTLSLCEDCARQHQALEVSAGFGLAELLAGLTGLSKDADPRLPEVKTICSTCGLHFEEFRQGGKFGCADCYPTFREPLRDLLRGIHGASRHVGLKPHEFSAVQVHKESICEANLDGLKRQLDAAIQQQDFELAIRLRDQIRGVE